MKLRFKRLVASLFLGIGLVIVISTNALADGPPYSEEEPNNFNYDANQIVLYNNVNGLLPKGDIDWYKIYIPKSDNYEFCFGSDNGTKTINVTIYDENKKVVFQGYPDAKQRIIVDKTLNGLYYIEVKDEENNSNENLYNFEFYPQKYSNQSVYRFAGQDRYDTSLSIFKNNWTYADYAVITTGEAFPDALSAAPLAKKYKAPIILTKPNELSGDMEKQIESAGVTKVFIVGGEGVVSKNIEDKLTSMGITCTRLGGKDRYETSLAVAKQLNPSGEVIIATGTNFPDALSVAPFAALCQMPILLVDKDNVSSELIGYLVDHKIYGSVMVGGTGVISENVESILSKYTEVARLSGTNRYETNVAILNYFKLAKLNEMYFATGEQFPDALSGSVVAAAGGHPIVLVDNNPDLSTIKYIAAKKSNIFGKCIFGGEGAVKESTIVNMIE